MRQGPHRPHLLQGNAGQEGGGTFLTQVATLFLVQIAAEWRYLGFRLILVTLTLVAAAPASRAGGGQSPNASDRISPAELIRAAVAHEVAAANDPAVKHMFRSRKQNPHGSQTKLYVETKDAMAGMVIAYNDQPLTPDQRSGEEARLDSLLNNPEQLQHKRSREKEDADRTLRIVKALADAFLYDYADTEAGPAGVGKPGDQLVRLNFRPNPAYEPPSRVEQVLTGMHGYVLIDPEIRRVARIDGTLFKDVSFGWGFLGHLDKGGQFVVEQSDVGDGTWDITRMNLRFTGKILLFKGISIESDEVLSDFHRVPPDIDFVQAVQLLKMEQAKRAKNGPAETSGTAKTPR
jgi:hypothetical protein